MLCSLLLPFWAALRRRMTAKFDKSLKSALLLQIRMYSVVFRSFRHGGGYGALRQSLAANRLCNTAPPQRPACSRCKRLMAVRKASQADLYDLSDK
jgi:hypothetical protein